MVEVSYIQKRACSDCPKRCPDPESATSFCDFILYDNNNFLKIGGVCKLDHSYCSNFCREDLVHRCPTLNAWRRGEPVGKITNLDHPGPKHVVRTGKFGDFVTGMPPEYSRGDLKEGAAEE